jgi:predicted MFS family arabinose efflux permease
MPRTSKPEGDAVNAASDERSSGILTPDRVNPAVDLKNARWRLAGFLAFAAALNYADRAAMSSVLPAVRSDLGISDVSLGLLGSVFLWSYALGSPIAGGLADRHSRRRIVIGSLVAWSAVTALMGLATGLSMLLLLRFFLGAAECLFLPAAIAFIAERHPPATRARALSFISIGVNGGMILGGAFAGFMADHFGWRAAFGALGIAGIVLAFLARSLLPTPAPVRAAAASHEAFRAALKYLLRVPTYHLLLAEAIFSGLGLWIFFSWLPLYFSDTYNMTLATAGFAGTFMLQISVMLGIFAGGWISDRVAGVATHRRMLLYAIFNLAAAPFLLLFLGHPAFSIVVLAISAFSFLRGLGQANHNPTQCEVVPAQFRSTGVGIMNACATGAGGFGVLFAGLLKRSLGLEAIFATISGLFILAGAVLLIGYRYFIQRDVARAQAWESARMPSRALHPERPKTKGGKSNPDRASTSTAL